jgi:c-di-GMP-binding flagellar brake protein YcgR
VNDRVQDKRKAQGALRLRKFIPVAVEDKMTFTLFRASIADISATGARLITSEYLSRGTRWQITMKDPPLLSMKAEVRWVKMDTNPRPGATPQFQVGVQFIEMAPDDAKRLAGYLDFERIRSEKI